MKQLCNDLLQGQWSGKALLDVAVDQNRGLLYAYLLHTLEDADKSVDHFVALCLFASTVWGCLKQLRSS